MKKIVSVEIGDPRLSDLIFEGFERLNREFGLHAEVVGEALHEVIDNILIHAYESSEKFLIKTVFSLGEETLRVDVTDTGIPFDFTRYRSESLALPPDHSKGFYRIYDLVDRFYFSNIAGVGKCFTLIHSIDFLAEESQAVPLLHPAEDAKMEGISVRLFGPEDAEGIARLIYRNYHYTYYKALYYEAEAIRAANAKGDIISVVAAAGDDIVGHFAIIPSSYADIGEIGAAVVDPKFKQMGIMNRMFDHVVATARQKRLKAIYGEGMMLHPYSQKANLRHGMVESAIMLGEVPSSMEIEHRMKTLKRSGVVIGYLLFEKPSRFLTLPVRYREMIEETYENGSIPLNALQIPLHPPHSPAISFRLNSLLKTGTIVIESEIEAKALDPILHELMTSRCDMIFADINLHRIKQIDAVVSLLNERLFFYSGVMFDCYHNEDYLRMQRKNTAEIEEEQLICYSAFTTRLLAFILEDEASLFLPTQLGQ